MPSFCWIEWIHESSSPIAFVVFPDPEGSVKRGLCSVVVLRHASTATSILCIIPTARRNNRQMGLRDQLQSCASQSTRPYIQPRNWRPSRPPDLVNACMFSCVPTSDHMILTGHQNKGAIKAPFNNITDRWTCTTGRSPFFSHNLQDPTSNPEIGGHQGLLIWRMHVCSRVSRYPITRSQPGIRIRGPSRFPSTP